MKKPVTKATTMPKVITLVTIIVVSVIAFFAIIALLLATFIPGGILTYNKLDKVVNTIQVALPELNCQNNRSYQQAAFIIYPTNPAFYCFKPTELTIEERQQINFNVQSYLEADGWNVTLIANNLTLYAIKESVKLRINDAPNSCRFYGKTFCDGPNGCTYDGITKCKILTSIEELSVV